MAQKPSLYDKCNVLLRDYGYKVADSYIISCGIRGFTSDSIFGRCRNALDAVESLIPIIRCDEFSTRYRKIMKG